MKDLTLGIIGAGNMAAAILNGVVSKGLFSPARIFVSNPHEDKLERFKSQGMFTTVDNVQVAQSADLTVLAVKPQKFEEVLEEIASCCVGKCVISIAAGISTEWIRTRLPGARVIRVMPNTPLQLGLGATAVARADDVPEELFQLVCSLFSAAGSVSVIPESQMNAVVPVSSSSPAFFFRMADVMVRWAQKQGMDPQVALNLAASAMRGSAEMLLHSGKTAEELTCQVCSPGGTTLAALTAFDDMDFDGLMTEAMARCAKRSRELGK